MQEEVSKWTQIGEDESGHTKYDIECHMVFHVTMVTFRMALLMNK